MAQRPFTGLSVEAHHMAGLIAFLAVCFLIAVDGGFRGFKV